MSRLIESIRLDEGKFSNLFYHEQRMIRSLNKISGINPSVDLQKSLGEQECPQKGLYKCRIVYDHVSAETTFTPYEPRRLRRVKVVEDDQISYAFKFSDRQAIDRLFARRG